MLGPLLERRRFECLCGQKATYEIYERNNPCFLSCMCGKNFQFDWVTERFVSNTEPKQFTLIEEEHEQDY